MKKLTIALVIILIAAVVSVSTYGTYTFLNPSSASSPSPEPSPTASQMPTSTPSPEPSTSTLTQAPSSSPIETVTQGASSSPSSPQKKTVAVVDGLGVNVTVEAPVERVITLDPGLTEIVCVLGCESKLVGRESTSTMIVRPPSIEDVPVVDYNVEAILELEPDLIISGAALDYYRDKYEQLQAAGIPVFVTDSASAEPSPFSNETVIDRSCDLVTTLSKFLGAEENATKYVNFCQHYNDLVRDRIANLTRDQMPVVMLEWAQPYMTSVISYQQSVGAINIAENQTVTYPVLSAEFVVSANPDIIIEAITSPTHNETDFIVMSDSILNRPELSDVNAVKNGKVYIYDYVVMREGVGGHEVVGFLYWAKWCHPELFADIDPAAVNSELNQLLFGRDAQGTYVYPQG
ncbi:MAG: ABC transporter substrate-binding protein [Candidatus Bathyarchaeota archaeon]|nr:ABC transporter substrate-binding protein [Candidatus Bathyarchaeota archaeon]